LVAASWYASRRRSPRTSDSRRSSSTRACIIRSRFRISIGSGTTILRGERNAIRNNFIEKSCLNKACPGRRVDARSHAPWIAFESCGRCLRLSRGQRLKSSLENPLSFLKIRRGPLELQLHFAKSDASRIPIASSCGLHRCTSPRGTDKVDANDTRCTQNTP
jgi:hypothetical protein